jgi:autotransporter-associated beta strand protein
MLVTVNTSGASVINDGVTIAIIPDSTHIVLSQNSVRGNTSVNFNFSWPSNYTGGTVLLGGTLALGSVNANDAGLGTGPITFNGGTLSLFDWNGNNLPGSGTLPNNLVVNGNGTILAPQRGTIAGSVTGSGNLTLSIPYLRTDLTGDWSQFYGQLNVITTSSSSGDLRLHQTTGLPLGAISLGAKTQAYYTGTVATNGTSISIGELSGVAGTFLRGGTTANATLTWTIGGRNSNATFAGTITEQFNGTLTSNITGINKVGDGTWTLSGTNSYLGPTTVTAGTLLVSGTLGNTSTVDVKNGGTLTLSGGSITAPLVLIESGGALGGSGTLNGPLVNNGTVNVGSGQTITFNGNVTNNGVMIFTGSAAFSNSAAYTNNGTLDLITSALALPANFTNNGVVLHAKDVKIQDCSMQGGVFTVDIQSYPGHNFQLQYSNSLVPPNWQNIGPAQTGDGTVLTFTDSSNASATQLFYRIVVSP